jgi:ATP-dependent protease ClpP protease subunit
MPLLMDEQERRDRRIILINNEIHDDAINIGMLIVGWNEEDDGLDIDVRIPIKIWISSNGGDALTTLGIIDVVKLSKTPVITIGIGKVFSSGCLLLMSGHARYIFPSTCCLIHDGPCETGGDTGKVLDAVKFFQGTEDCVKDFIAANSLISKEMLDQNFRRDWYLFSKEIIGYGIADEIIADIGDIF